MDTAVKLVCVIIGLCVIYSHALDDDEFRRALDVLQNMNKESEEKRAIHKCLPELDAPCDNIFSRCCEKHTCYWEDGYSMRRKGKCVECVSEGQKCQRDSQCCGHFQCDKGNYFWVDGTCQRFRRSGPCYRDGQCVTDCKKKWWHVNGTCE